MRKRIICRLLVVMMLTVCVFCTGASAAGRPDWQVFYQYFIQSGEYARVISSPVNEYRGMMMNRDQQWDSFAVYDMNRDGTPELIVRTEYGGLEQADVFTWSNDSVKWLGTMGGDNFFQTIIGYDDSRYPGLYTVMGGPAMKIDEYTMSQWGLQHRYVAMTSVDSNGDYTVAVNMKVSDDALYQLLRGSFLSGTDKARSLVWMRAADLQSDSAWTLFFSALTRPGAWGY